jgi:putative peptidoglycan lipid II flippase
MTRSASVVTVAVAASRLFGLIREQVLAYLLEARTVLDVYYAAFRIPNLLRDLFGEAILSKAFVTTFTDVDIRSGEESAWRLANLVFNAFAIIASIATIMGIFLSPFIVSVMVRGKGFDTAIPDPAFGFTDKRDLTVYATRIMFPYLLLVSLAAIAMGLLNSKRRFGVPASASAFFNIGSVVVGVLGYYISPGLGLHPLTGIAAGILAGGLLQFTVQIPSMWRVGFRYKAVLSFTDPDFKRVLSLMAPAVLGSAALQINVFLNGIFASEGAGWLAWNSQAFRIMHLAIGVFGVPISTATLPMLSKFVAQESMDEYKKTFLYALKMIFIVSLPASVGLIILNRPIVSLIYQRGEFGANDTVNVASALFCYAFGLCGYAGRQIAADGFIALKNMRVPVIVSMCTIAMNILMNYILIFRVGFDHRSLAVSTACSITVNFLVVLSLLWRRVGGFDALDLVSAFTKSMIAAVIMGIAVWLIYYQIMVFIGSKLALLSAIIIAIPLFYLLCRLLKLREVDQVVGAILEKFRR